MTKLFCDLKTDEEKSAFFLSGRGYETGVIAHSIQNDVAMAYQRCAEYRKELEALQSQEREDALRYRWLRDTLHGAKAGGGVEVNEARQVYETPEPGEEVRVYWYQDTPVGFYDVKGTTLDEAIDLARSVEDRS